MRMRMFVARLRHAHCTTNYLKEEECDESLNYTYFENKYVTISPLDVYFLKHDKMCMQLICATRGRDAIHIQE